VSYGSEAINKGVKMKYNIYLSVPNGERELFNINSWSEELKMML